MTVSLKGGFRSWPANFGLKCDFFMEYHGSRCVFLCLQDAVGTQIDDKLKDVMRDMYLEFNECL